MMLKLAAAGALALVSLACSERTENAAETAPAAQACEPPRIVLVKPGVTPPNATYQSSSMPPERFRGDNSAMVQFVSPAAVERICGGGAKPICGFKRIACRMSDGRLIMPNPCGFGTESYGRIMCHELAHVNFWPAEHGE